LECVIDPVVRQWELLDQTLTNVLISLPLPLLFSLNTRLRLLARLFFRSSAQFSIDFRALSLGPRTDCFFVSQPLFLSLPCVLLQLSGAVALELRNAFGCDSRFTLFSQTGFVFLL
jgi:hypothetical protein